jgi:nuclear transport factor 2 (NTF2) superfamily protein
MTDQVRPPVPPFTYDTAIAKVRKAEDAWNTRDPASVSLAYTLDSSWRNRSSFVNGREEIVVSLAAKWDKELGYRLIKEIWAFTQMAMQAGFPNTVLRDSVLSHPTMAEGLNVLFSTMKRRIQLRIRRRPRMQR